MDPMYKVTGHDSLQQLETQGRDQLFWIGEMLVWATDLKTARWIYSDHVTGKLARLHRESQANS